MQSKCAECGFKKVSGGSGSGVAAIEPNYQLANELYFTDY